MSQQTGPFLDQGDFSLEEDTPTNNPRFSDIVAPQPGTIPERMYALEIRMASQEKLLRSLMPVLKAQAVWAKVAKNAARFSPIWVPVISAQFPQTKEWLKALLDTISLFQ